MRHLQELTSVADLTNLSYGHSKTSVLARCYWQRVSTATSEHERKRPLKRGLLNLAHLLRHFTVAQVVLILKAQTF